MTLQDAANFAQVIGGVAVIASLVFLGLEVRQAGREVLASSQQAQADAHSSYLLAMATDPGLLRLAEKGLSGEALTPLEAVQETLYLSAVFSQFQATFHCATMFGTRGRGNWQHLDRALARWMVAPQVRRWWAADRMLFAEDFRELVDQKLATSQASPQSAVPLASLAS